MDGLPGMQRALAAGQRENVAPIKKMVGPLAPKAYHSGTGISLQQLLAVALISFILGMLLALKGDTLLMMAKRLDVERLKGMLSGASA